MGTGRNFSTTDSYASDALPRKYASGFQLALLIKDVGIAEELFDKVDFDTKLPELINGYLKQSFDMLSEDADHTECLKGWEKRAGVTLKTGQPDGSSVTAMRL